MEIKYKLPPISGFEKGGNAYVELKMQGYRQYGGYLKYLKFELTNENVATSFI